VISDAELDGLGASSVPEPDRIGLARLQPVPSIAMTVGPNIPQFVASA
jgi:hypothetical protein